MDNEQLMQALSGLLDEKLQPIKDRLDKMEGRLDKVEGQLGKIEGRLNVVEVLQRRTTKKLDDLRLDMMVFQGNVRQDIHDLGDQMETVVEILKINEILPR